jgi:hypothetical protein
MSGTLQPARPATLTRYFVGFSTQNSVQSGVRTLYDIDLINIDLMTAFQTRIGERVMRPDYGCKLWDYVMEPLTPNSRDDIVQEVIRICALDSRLVLQDVAVTPQDAGFTVAVLLQYLPWRVSATFTATFEQQENIRTSD